jgi:hypothetical protein
MRHKPREAKRQRDLSLPAAAYDDGNESSDDEKQQARRKKRRAKKVEPSDVRNSLNLGNECTMTDNEIENDIAFCCKICNCSDAAKARFKGDEFIQQSEECLWHRRCCHNAMDPGVDWLPEYNRGLAELEANMMGDDFFSQELIVDRVDARDVYDKYLSNKRQESELYNEDGDTCKYSTVPKSYCSKFFKDSHDYDMFVSLLT